MKTGAGSLPALHNLLEPRALVRHFSTIRRRIFPR
jgi:hypothetical protein